MKCADACVCVCDKEEEEDRKAEREGERSCCPQDPSLRFAVCLHAVSPPHSRDLRRVFGDSSKANIKTDLQMTESRRVPRRASSSPVFHQGELSMVLTASFPRPPGFGCCRRPRSQPLLGGPGPGKPGTKRVKPPAHAPCGSAGPRCGCSGLAGPGTCFESRREALRRRRGGAGRRHVPAAAGEGSISFAARPALACLGAPTPRPAPPAAPLPAAQPADRGAGPAPPAGGFGASAALTPARVPAIQLVRSMASPSWRLKVSGGRPRVGGGGRSGSGRSGRPGGRGAGGAVSGGRGAGRGGAGVPAASREASGRSGAVGALDSRSRSALAGPAAAARGPERVGRAGTVRAAASSWRRLPGLPGGVADPTGRDGELGPRGVPLSMALAPANHPPAVPAFLPNWDSRFAAQAPDLLGPGSGAGAGLHAPLVHSPSVAAGGGPGNLQGG